MGETYEAAGVSIGAGEAAVDAIKADVRSTFRPEVIGDIGGFGGLFRFDPTTGAGEVVGFLFGGSIQFTAGGNTEGAPVVGSFSSRVFSVPF